MSAVNKFATEHATFLRLHFAFESKLFRTMSRLRNDFVVACASDYQIHSDKVFQELTKTFHFKVIDALKAHYNSVIPAFAIHALSQIKKFSPLLLDKKSQENLFTSLIDKWIKDNGLDMATNITDTAKADILGAISDGEEAGAGIGEIASDIRDVTSLTPFRAWTIAVTETHNAATFGSIEAVRDTASNYGMQILKHWIPTLDDRTRPAHAAMQGSDGIPLDQPFIVDNEEMDRPGDPSGSPENVINCRCALTYEEDSPESL